MPTSAFPGIFLIRCAIMVKCHVKVTMAAVYQHILCARSFIGLTFRLNHMVPRHVHLHFGGGEKDPQRDKCLS